ncbi:hypothetical protein [Pollutimonas thiosulfatoxidans]|uniref:Uncharacterized protein n=1 Tax=Pollutimonas thiosulfatoxidans TaxID=2028345 RepID=A0A410GBW6_9BURK|nr:hypothetical protein [Pollutimonas thiosulfatoxidans]QAA93797.1 hypothetical protein CKA81_08080 [Pollutimonas thiosulfatoxidans]
MNQPENNKREQLLTLTQWLTCDDLDEHEANRIIDLCLQVQASPTPTLLETYGADAAKVVEYDPQGLLAFVLFTELEDYFAYADTVDELYEQIVDAFEQPALPDYPYEQSSFDSVSGFFAWVDQQLLAHHTKYQLIHFGQSYTHDFQVLLVYRDRVDDILALCGQLGVQAERCN